MSEPENPSNADTLIAGLDDWLPNPITPEEWVGAMGNYDLAVGYSFLFWPTFVTFEGYVLRQGVFGRFRCAASKLPHPEIGCRWSGL